MAKVSILTNADKSSPFQLHWTVPQGDPLSPLLSDISLESLEAGVKSHPRIHGKTCELSITKDTLIWMYGFSAAVCSSQLGAIVSVSLFVLSVTL